jgi:hypothetical protein
VKLLQERKGKTMQHIGIGENFLNRTAIAQKIRERIGKWKCDKPKRFCTLKETATKKTTFRTGENLCQLYIIQGLITGIHRELKKLNFPKINNPMSKQANELSDNSQKKKYTWPINA